MKRVVVFAAFLAFLGGLTGCGTSPTDDTINEILTQVDEAANKLSAVRSELEKAVRNADEKKKKITVVDLKEAIEQTKKLRPVGQKLLKLKADVDNLKSQVTPDQREELASRYGSRLANALQRLEKVSEDLDRTVEKVATRVDEERTIESLKTALRESKQEFESLTRRN